MKHECPDRVPLFYRDVPEVERRLLRDLKLTGRNELLEYLGVDFRWVEPKYVGPALQQEGCDIQKDIGGVGYKFIEFEPGAGYWEAVESPLEKCSSVAELETYPWPTCDLFDW